MKPSTKNVPTVKQLRAMIGNEPIADFAKRVKGYSERSVYAFFAEDNRSHRLRNAICEALGVKQ